jgi:DNA-binding transcriptional LysR family regulator
MQRSAGATMVTIRQLRAFVAVARHASFTRAAAVLHLSQSAVSLLVRDLERQLDTVLFERGRRLVPTELGADFLRSSTRVLDDLDLAVAHLRGARDARRHVVRLAVGHLLASTLVPEVVAAFMREHGDVEVVIVDCPVEQVAPRVSAGEVDAGIGSIDAELRLPELRVDLLLRDSIHVASPPSLPPLRADGGHGSVPWRRLRGEAMIVANPANLIWRRVQEGLAQQQFALDVAHQVAMYSTGLAMVRQGLGRMLAPGFCARSAALRDLLVQPLVRPVIRWDVSVLRRRSAPASATLDALLARLQRAVRPG